MTQKKNEKLALENFDDLVSRRAERDTQTKPRNIAGIILSKMRNFTVVILSEAKNLNLLVPF